MSTAAISIHGLVKSYGDFTAVDGITLDIYRGEIFALLGPNGAGKTTTIEILEGYREPTSGTVQVLGKDPSNLGSEKYSWRNQIGIVLQNTSDVGELSVRSVLTHFAQYYSHPRNVDDVLQKTGLKEKEKALVHTLSGGQRRRLDVALGIIGSPELLFLDEPTTGFDPKARREFWELIRSLKEEGTTILLTTHYLDEAEALADRVGIIAGGKIVEISSPDTIGGRHSAQARVAWAENGETRSVESSNPTQVVLDLQSKFGGEVPELQVIRPTLEDIYLQLIGEDA